MSAKRRYRCPECHRSDGLWEGIEFLYSGWRSVDERLEPGGAEDTGDLIDQNASGEIGCSKCDWRSWSRDSLEAIGINGEPLPVVHPNQLQIEAA